jgi:hypothetical protein
MSTGTRASSCIQRYIDPIVLLQWAYCRFIISLIIASRCRLSAKSPGIWKAIGVRNAGYITPIHTGRAVSGNIVRLTSGREYTEVTLGSAALLPRIREGYCDPDLARALFRGFSRECPLYPPKRSFAPGRLNVRFVPIADIRVRLFPAPSGSHAWQKRSGRSQ